MTLTQFTYFPLLPTELRLLIWRASLSPRAVTLTSLALPLSSPTPPPITLSVSRESRSESLRFYITLGPGIYFHPSLDTLYIPRSTGGFLGYADQARDFGTLPIPGLSKIQKVAVDYVLPEIRREWEAYSKFCLVRGFKGLREGGLVIGTERERLPVGETQDGGHQHQQQSQMELREPRGDKEGVRRIMEIVRESFRVEGVGEDGKRWEVEEGLARDEWGKFEIDTGLELRPLVRVVRV
ncbi:hypothetical protein QBC42DRAFT_342114 [Cladorrhinum samala]|uniref:2EXR domain-containing protein n=1 Tax=Cladorrhinum samala TaxID=585594 RepID=A0AAV9H8S6_9PEZI|nr:hypothetical protein QBC42DRAFT_342114 [Cladorrhinum samala]